MRKNRKAYSIDRKLARTGFMFTVPCLLYFAIFSFYPIVYALMTSFTNRMAYSRTSETVGFSNYIYLFTKSNGGFSLLNSLRATLVFTIGTFVPIVIMSLILAVFLIQLRKDRQRSFFQLAFYTPAVLSSVVAASIWMLMFDPRGLINQVSNILLRTSGRNFNWMVNPIMLQASTMIVYFWKNIGYFVILFITGLAGIPQSIYEAATIDSANKRQIFFRITLPLLKPIVMLVSITSMLRCLKTFSTQYMFYQNGGTARQPIDVITLNIYFTGIVNGRLGRASAMSIILFMIMLLFTYFQFSTAKMGNEVEF